MDEWLTQEELDRLISNMCIDDEGEEVVKERTLDEAIDNAINAAKRGSKQGIYKRA